jgi:hypothetical protein
MESRLDDFRKEEVEKWVAGSTCYVDCQPKEQLLCLFFINPKELFPQPAIRGQKPQDSYPIISSMDRRILRNVTASVTR